MDTLTQVRNIILQYGNWSGPGWSNGTGYPGRRLTDAEKFGVGVDAYDGYVAKAHDLNEIIGEENLRANLANLGFTNLGQLNSAGDYGARLERDGRFVDARHYLDAASPQNQAAVADALIMYEQQVMRSNLQFAVDYLTNGVDVWDNGLSAVRMGLQLGAASHIFLGEAADSEARLNDLRQFASADIDQQVLDYLSQNFVSPGSGNDASRFMEWPGGDEYNRSVDFEFMIGADREQILETAVALRDAWRSGNPDIAAALAEMEQIGFSNFDEAFSLMQQLSDESLRAPQECFLAGTEISMWDGTKKPIEEITPDDWVTSYDKDGNLVPGKVTRVFQHQAKHILDVFGLHVTPGHVTFCGDGKFEGQHVPIIDILRSDGALVRENGQKVRACTNEPLGTPKDSFVLAITGKKQPDGSIKVRDKGKIRLGTRYITEDGYDISVADLIFGADAMVSPEGLVIQKIGGQGMPFLWPFTEMLPKPEDYILQRSALMLNEIYQAAEWEAVQPQMQPPVMGDLGPVQPANDAILQAMPPNVPLSMQGSSNKPAMNRKQRKAHEAKQRKIAKRLRGQSTLH